MHVPTDQPPSLANVPACELERDEGRVMVIQSLSVTEITEVVNQLAHKL